MSDASEVALFAHQEPGPRFTRKAIISAIRATGVPEKTATSRIDQYIRRNLVQLRDAPGTHSRFAAVDMAAALVLSAIHDAGVEDSDALLRVSIALYGQQPIGTESQQAEIKARNQRLARFSHHPIGWALAGTALGQPWSFTLAAFRIPETETRVLMADLIPLGMGEREIWRIADRPELSPIAFVSTVLDHQLAPVLRLLSPLTRSGH